MTALCLSDAAAWYGNRQVIGPVSLQLQAGERVALVGQSGAGKSTLLDLMYRQARQRSALIPQQLGLVEPLSVFHNVFMGRLGHHATWYNLANLVRPFRKELAAIEPLLQSLSLADKLHAPAAALSGGEKQRAAVARALYQGAEILLADEPVSALDGPLSQTVMTLLCQRYPTSVIALHDVDLALRHATRIIGIRDGVIALDEPSQRLSVNDLLPIY